MPPRRQVQIQEAPQKPAVGNSEEDFDFLASQQSTGSDDIQQQELRETLEKLYASERAKKQEQKEKKFLDVAKKRLMLDITTPAKEVHSAMKTMEQLYQTFLLDYAAIEDRIHKKLVQIREEQENLTKLVKEHHQHNEEEFKNASAMHVAGLAKTRTACTAFETILERLMLPKQDADT